LAAYVIALKTAHWEQTCRSSLDIQWTGEAGLAFRFYKVSFSEMDENVETLIEEVKKRPAIYDKTLKEYANTNVKKQLWEEVCVSSCFQLEGHGRVS
jgi:hypothetical protein